MSLTLSQRLSLKRFTKGEEAHAGSITLNHRRIFILPSKGGLALAMVILLMLVASINYNNSMGFVFTFLLAAVSQASTLYSFRNLSGLNVSLAKAPPCYAGSMGHIKLYITENNNRNRWTIHASHLHKQTNFDLVGDTSLLVNLPVKLKTRGWYSPKTITLSTQFPFGFFRAWSPLRFNEPILVYPSPIDFETTLSISQDSDHLDGSSSPLTGTDDFAGLKPYQQGENYRHINWKALAAEKGFYSNVFSAEQSTQTWLDWQACTQLSIEDKLSQLCFWVLRCEKKGTEYGLRLPKIELTPNHGARHQHACLKALALYGS
ncbi:MAG: hypothetical protein A6F70_02040 [Cycloclasticus sp. symbiont of Bathymodiolus heckerae]|nr:MAG: hypothetical protein A6F70_02040 [Cycloclasticus sp. symbiont of Bathymodiolus heckerae]